MKKVCFLFLLGIYGSTFSQTFFQNSDTLLKKRVLLTSISNATIWSSSIIALNSIWYSGYEKTPFHTFDDSKNWLQMDKVGHVYAAYHFSEIVSKTYRWTGLSQNTSAIIGASSAFGYQLSLEFLDSRSSGWGFSWSDVLANGIGSSVYLGQELAFKKQLFKLKFSYRESGLAKYRPEVLGSNFQEKLLKDYNAQTYWLSFSPFAFSKNDKLPKWLNLAIGYSAHNKLVGDQDVYTTPDGLQTFYAKREFILSLDIDVKALNIKKQWLKTLISPFNSIKIPFPALVWQGNVLYGKAIY